VTNRSIVLLYPRAEPDLPDPEKLLGLPLAALTVARPLVRAGYDVRIVDQNVTPRVIDELARLERPLFVGLSVIGGHTITSAKGLAREVGKLWPGVPRVWGGWSPTLLPELYADPSSAPWVDAFVSGRGEAAALEIARRMEAGLELSGIPGVSWRDAAGELHLAQPAAFDDPSHAGPLPYHLIRDPSLYILKRGMVNYVSSYGCPHRCEFCGIPAYTRTFVPLPNAVVLEELALLRAQGLREVLFLDDNFFTSKPRVLGLARGLVAAGLDLAWHSNGRIDQVLALSLEELGSLARSGCRSINVGYETGDQLVADGVKKDIVVDEVYELARRLHAAGIRLSLNFMVGLPGETPEGLVRSLETLKRIHALQPDLDVCWYMFAPAPKTPLWTRLIEQGVLQRPRTLRDQEELQPLYLEHPWLYESPPRRVLREWRAKHKAIVWYFWFAYVPPRAPLAVLRPLYACLQRWCRLRYERRWFRLRADWLVALGCRRLSERFRWGRAALLRTRLARDWAARRATRAEPRAAIPQLVLGRLNRTH
jgi:anaerobic magnesium-protoporphyrin IX monomethyl ester cyclase